MSKSGTTYILLTISMLLWGSLYPISKFLMNDIDPLFLAFLRCFIAVIALTPFFILEIRKNDNKIDKKSLLNFTAAGLTGVTIFAVLLFFGIKHSTASNGSILTNTQPVFAAILAPLLIGEHLNGVQIGGIAVGFAGMFVVVTGGQFNSVLSENPILMGNLLLLGGAVSMSLYSIVLKSSIRKYGGLIATWFSMSIGTFFLFLISLASGKFFSGVQSVSTIRDIFLIIILGIASTALPYLLFNMSLNRITVVRATAFKFLIPISGIGLSIIFLGERPALITYAGILIVILSVFLIQRSSMEVNAIRKTTT